MKPPFTLVSDTISKDTVTALEQLLEEARKGQIIGIAFAAMRKQRKYIANVAGEAYRNPTWTRGMVAAIEDQLREMVHHR